MAQPAVEVPRGRSASKNLAGLEFEYLERFGVYTRLHYEDRSFTNFEELQYAGGLARVLTEYGVGAGDRVLVLMPNSPDLTASFHAIWTIGAVVVPVMPQWTAPEIAYLLRNSEAAVLLTAPLLAPRLKEAAAGIDTVKHLLVFGDTAAPGAENIAARAVEASGIETPVERMPSDLAMLLYTSGTTSRPKGVMITHANFTAALDAAYLRNLDLKRSASIHILPLTHVFGLIMINLSNRWGFSSVLLPQFDPVKTFQAIERHQAGYLAAVPTMLTYLLHHPERKRFNTSSLFRITTGGAGLPEQLRINFQDVFACRVENAYGMTETSAVGSAYGEATPYRAGSAGPILDGVAIHILDNNNKRLPPRAVGEICMAGEHITPGYWRDPEATKEAFVDGWFHTGDVGYLDEDNYLFITDRKKDLIIKGGENISPREIEEALYMHPAVADAAVVGIPDALFGEEICAVIQLKPGAEATEEEIREHTRRFVTKFKVPARVIFQQMLPRISNGKIAKREIRMQLARVSGPAEDA